MAHYDGTSSTWPYDDGYVACRGPVWCGSSRMPSRVLVTIPQHWSGADVREFVKLVNEDTHTGWTVSMLITGDVLICDPRIETRSMSEFVPLLKWRADVLDRGRIDGFFSVHGVGD